MKINRVIKQRGKTYEKEKIFKDGNVLGNRRCLVIPTVVSAQSLPSNGTEASKKHVSANTQTPANKRIVL
ncbi:hypothetical protein [Neobacillus muris]|uniref:hypothetical protein n=1 Tax=Neobacillus muris TaxID=2941334 RepID=UPI0020404399|nr:hypothetical protein [Neobacillus muris]